MATKFTLEQLVKVKLIDGREVTAKLQIDVPALAQELAWKAQFMQTKQTKLKNGVIRCVLMQDSVPTFPAVDQPTLDQPRRTEGATVERMPSMRSLSSLLNLKPTRRSRRPVHGDKCRSLGCRFGECQEGTR